MSPDHNAIVGEVSQPRRFLYATGFSGHGFQQAPAVGEHLAELVAGRRSDARPLAALARPLRPRRRAPRALRGLMPDLRAFVLARHGESTLNLERRVNGDPGVPVRADGAGREESRRLGEQMAHFPLDACVHTRFPRTLETADDRARRARGRARSSSSRSSTTSTSATSRASRSRSTAPGSTATRAATAFPGGESLDDAARRYAAAFRALLELAVAARCSSSATRSPSATRLNGAAGSDSLDGPAHEIGERGALPLRRGRRSSGRFAGSSGSSA